MEIFYCAYSKKLAMLSILVFSVVGRAKGQPKGIDRSKVRVGSRKLAGGPQRNTERQLVSPVLRWAG